MTKEQRIKAINMHFEGMLNAQFLMEEAVTSRDKNLAEAIYEAHHSIYLVLTEDRLRDKKVNCG